MGLVAFIMAYALFAFIFYILQVIAYWKIFTKAGEEGWKSIIPILLLIHPIQLTFNIKHLKKKRTKRKNKKKRMQPKLYPLFA